MIVLYDTTGDVTINGIFRDSGYTYGYSFHDAPTDMALRELVKKAVIEMPEDMLPAFFSAYENRMRLRKTAWDLDFVVANDVPHWWPYLKSCEASGWLGIIQTQLELSNNPEVQSRYRALQHLAKPFKVDDDPRFRWTPYRSDPNFAMAACHGNPALLKTGMELAVAMTKCKPFMQRVAFAHILSEMGMDNYTIGKAMHAAGWDNTYEILGILSKG